MDQFEYMVTTYSSDTFKQLVYFCSEAGECALEQVPSDQLNTLRSVLNEQGRQGWELVQLSFGTDGVLGFWKRKVEAGRP